MKKFKPNKGLLDKKRFEEFQRKENLYLRNLSVKKGIRIMEGLLDSGLIEELKKAQKELQLKECKRK
jgi:hypothetical protein